MGERSDAHAMEGDLSHEGTFAVCGRARIGTVRDGRTVPHLRHQPRDRLQVGRAVRGGRSCGSGGPVAGPASPPERGAGGGGGGDPGDAGCVSDLGPEEVAGLAPDASAGGRLAGRQHHRRPLEPAWADGAAEEAASDPAVHRAVRRLPLVEYPDGRVVRVVQKRGEFYWRTHRVFLGEAFGGEPIGLEPLDGRYWLVYYTTVALGVFDAHRRRMLTAGEAAKVAADGRFGRPFRSAPGPAEPSPQNLKVSTMCPV